LEASIKKGTLLFWDRLLPPEISATMSERFTVTVTLATALVEDIAEVAFTAIV
jgi:hypothetical protein